MTVTRVAAGDTTDSGAAAAVRLTRRIVALSGALPGGLPTVMSSPPTVTLSAAFTTVALALAGSSITSARNIPSIKTASQNGTPVFNTDVFTFFGQPVNQRGIADGNSKASVQSNLGVSGLSGGPYRVEFNLDAASVELQLRGNSGSYRLWVNGQLVTQSAQAGPSATGNMYNLLVDFTTRGTRRITADFTNGQGFAGINLGPLDSAWPSTAPVGPRLLILGDSYVDGANGVNAIDTYAFTLGHLLGCRDVQTSGIGGTGLLATAGGQSSTQTKINYRPRLQTDVIAHAPDILLIQGSVNDPSGSFANSAISAEMQAVVREARRGLPTAVIVTTGILRPAGSLTGAEVGAASSLREAAALAAPDLHIDAWPDYTSSTATAASGSSRNWFWGTGKSSATTGDGNADLYMSSDGVHPTAAGHDYLALRIAAEITRARLLA